MGPRAPLVGREAELELLENTFARALRDGRAHLFTIYGEPGVGKSRLIREFLDGLERASVFGGRCLPYGEGVTYWPLAEMIKAAAGISDDDPLEEAFEKLRECCAEETVADVLGLAAGHARGARRRAQLAGDRLGGARDHGDARGCRSRSFCSSRTSTGRRSRCSS